MGGFSQQQDWVHNWDHDTIIQKDQFLVKSKIDAFILIKRKIDMCYNSIVETNKFSQNFSHPSLASRVSTSVLEPHCNI